MKKITNIDVNPPHEIVCTFEDGTIRKADISELLKSPVFQPLRNPMNLLKAENRGYFVEWPDWEVDLSADTLWHLGIPVLKETLEIEPVQ
jgi:Protein of unknown function (DUF2442)